MRVALLHLGHSTPLVVSIIFERSAVLATFAIVYLSSNRPCTLPPQPLSHTVSCLWGDSEGAAKPHFTRLTSLVQAPRIGHIYQLRRGGTGRRRNRLRFLVIRHLHRLQLMIVIDCVRQLFSWLTQGRRGSGSMFLIRRCWRRVPETHLS